MGPTLLRLLALAWLLLAITARAAQPTILPEPRQIGPSARAWIGPYEGPDRHNQGFRMNLGFVVGTQAVAVVDSGYTAAMAEVMLRQIRAITPLPVRFVINTNSQPHRFMGNEVFRQAGAKVIAASSAAQRMEQDGAQFARGIETILGLPAHSVAPPGRPDILLEAGEVRTLDLGGDIRVTVREVGRAHTRGSLIAEVPADRVVFAGDVLYGGRLLSLLPDGHIGGWIAAYEALRGLESSGAATFIPGHGQPGPLDGFDHPTLAYLRTLKAHMDQAVKRGTDLAAALNSLDTTAWKNLANFDDLAGRNGSNAYLESEAENF